MARAHILPALVVFLTFMGCTKPPPPFSVGNTATGHIAIYEKKIPLPPGSWTVIRTKASSIGQKYASSDSLPVFRLSLVNFGEELFRVTMRINIVSAGGTGFLASNLCQKKSLIFIQTKTNTDLGNQQCWWIERTWIGASPRNALRLGYHFADAYGFLQVAYYFDTADDDRVRRWGQKWLPKIKSAFNGTLLPAPSEETATRPGKGASSSASAPQKGRNWESRPIAVTWEGVDDLIAGTVSLQQGKRQGRMAITLPKDQGKCEGTYALKNERRGTWSVACTNNLTASGTFEAFGAGKGSSGKGSDSEGRLLRFMVGGR